MVTQEDIHECRTYLEILRIAGIRNGEKVKLKRHLFSRVIKTPILRRKRREMCSCFLAIEIYEKGEKLNDVGLLAALAF